TAGVECEGSGRLAEDVVGAIDVLDHDTVVGMYALAILDGERVRSVILIAENRQPAIGPIQHLQPQPRRVVEPTISLPAIDEPGLDLQFVGWKDLYAHAIEEPGRIRGDVGRLVGPVVEIVIAPEPDIGHEDAGLNVDAVPDVDVVSAIC